jgi:hypothetical protein
MDQLNSTDRVLTYTQEQVDAVTRLPGPGVLEVD